MEGKRYPRRARSRSGSLIEAEEADPLSSVANLFDVAMVFAVALLLAMVSALKVPELLFSSEEVTLVKNPGTPEMEIIRKKGVELDHYRMSQEAGTGEGQRLGICYRLESGEVIYVPEQMEEPAHANQ